MPLKNFAQNQLWCGIVALACELLAWTDARADRDRPPLGAQNDSVNKILDVLRSNGYKPALRIEHVEVHAAE